ncbi:uncharacterized protein BO66DRAFT_441820 [Aspergillus aculeatinus CBS 121060]|uniref:Uncharacterized protein n=1 Tax=Aspergillus aculeatinus CBS 121060 TaxID=1448322 RepID=A0ACD1GZU4_9EURO|nr:hypothetical protein BO66DRAFT_441820 [Aspergillus aculeatinus CBS 121060]RAH66695.1 hypothetical protein BO66DRAFT_441820 [Aspergillus aculeatinus CBS 121060]
MYMDHLHYAQNGYIPYEQVVDNVWLNVLQNYHPLPFVRITAWNESHIAVDTLATTNSKQGNVSIKSTDIREMLVFLGSAKRDLAPATWPKAIETSKPIEMSKPQSVPSGSAERDQAPATWPKAIEISKPQSVPSGSAKRDQAPATRPETIKIFKSLGSIPVIRANH